MTKLNKPTKREATREKAILAAIDCIYRDGFHAAHTNRIAEEAGVSWGVLQYHFGDKDGLLQAVIDHIFDDFTRTLEATTLEGDDLQQRVRQLIDGVATGQQEGIPCQHRHLAQCGQGRSPPVSMGKSS
ncbi:MAG: TetR/AcrR family transcriptional regulator [Haliea sp.]|nr:TetR/AcrR family transcriptional regulator [Haliea sp.]